MKRKFVLGASSVAILAALAAGNVPVHASTGTALVTFTSSSPPADGGRTLTLDNTAGQTLSSLDLSNGSNGFEAIVSDSNYSDTGFTANATMSNLYGYSNGTYNCSEQIPSAQVTLNSPSSLLDATGIAGSGVPTITLSGSLTSILPAPVLALIGGSATVTNMAVSTADQTYTEAQLAGGHTGDLLGSTLSTVDSTLPVSIGSVGTNQAFALPAADPTGAHCDNSAGSNPTPVTVENGTATESTVTSDVTSAINALGNPTTAQTLVSDNYFPASAVMTGVASDLGLSLGQISAYQSQILGALTPTVSSLGSVEVSGNYDATPIMSVTNPSSVPGGTYQGVLTVTLADGNPSS